MAARTRFQSRVWNVVELFRERFRKHDVLTYASGIAFQALKSLIPLTLLGLGILGALGRRDIWTEHIAPALQPRFDRPVYRAIDFAAEQIFAGNSAGVIAFSAVLTVWYVSSVVRGVMGAINRIYETDEERPLWLRWAISIGLAVCVVTAIVGAALLVLAVPDPAGAWEIPVGIVRWVGAIVMLTVAAALLVRLGPAKRRPARWVTAGAVLVIVTWLVTTALFRLYVASLANFKTAVGELTVFIVLMLWAYASSIVLLVGIEVDELLRAEARAERQRGILGVLFGIGR